LKKYDEAIQDANKTIELKPDWVKGYSRKGAALHGLSKYEEAIETYNKGLSYEPQNQLLLKAVSDVKAAKESSEDPLSSLGNIFGPDLFTKMAGNPKLAPFLAQPDLVHMLQECQQNPKNMNKYMQDQRMMQVMLGLMGFDGSVATNQDELDRAKEEAQQNLDSRAEQQSQPKREPTPEPVIEELSQEQLAREVSDKEKKVGDGYYKKKMFVEAIGYYDKAYEADKTNVAVLTNKAAALFELEKYQECIQVCELAVETGRDVRADFKLIGRALGRIGTSYFKLQDYTNAIKFFNKSLAEHRTPDILSKLRETESLKTNLEKQAYISPQIADDEREKGNEFFKGNKFPEAVRCYSEAIKRNPSDPRNFSNRAACYTKLMALPEAERDCDEAIKLDETFIKAYIRKAAVQFAKREYHKTIETCNLAIAKDTSQKHTTELTNQIQKAYFAMNQGNQTGNLSEEDRKRAISSPEVQEILGDPVMQTILKQMQEDPSAIKEHMRNPGIAKKMQILVNAGIVQMR